MNTIGWIGLGKMGIPMATRLLKAGFPVTVYNRTKEKNDAMISTGAKVALSPAELMDNNELIILMVSDDQAVREIFQGENGLLSSNATGRIIINMSTVSPVISREMADLCSHQQNHYLDAPVSGSVKPAETGELVIMSGGEEETFNRVKPVLEVMGKLVVYAGKTGSGNLMKLAVNLLLGIISQGLSESLIFAKNNGIEMGGLQEVINHSALGNVYMKMKGEAIQKNDFNPAFALKHIVKDLRLAKESGMSTPLGKTALDSFLMAEPRFAEEDIIAIYKFMNS